MATTYELIAKNVLGSSSSSVSFTSIPSTYTDLLVVMSARSDTSGTTSNTNRLRVNGAANDTNHSSRRLYGDGASATSSTASIITAGVISGPDSTANTWTSVEIYIPNYAGSTAKSMSIASGQGNNQATAFLAAIAGLWNDTAAITGLEFAPLGGGSYVTGSSFYLYGITKA